MDSPKAITAQFEPEFNVRTDVNNDGAYTNADDEYEPGGLQESALGEIVRLSDLRDNGAGHGQARVYNVIDLDGNYIICESDDIQELQLSQLVPFTDLDIDTSNVPAGLSIRLFRNKPVLVGPSEAGVGTVELGAPGELALPFDSAQFGSLPAIIYFMVDGTLNQSETFDLIFNATTEGKSVSDSLRFTVTSGIGQDHYFDSARDYIIENETRFFLDRKSYQYPGQFLRETKQIVVFRPEAARCTPVDAYNRSPKLFRIEEVAETYPVYDLITNGAFAGPNVGQDNMWDQIRGQLLISQIFSPLSTANATQPPGTHHFIGLDANQEFVIGTGDVSAYQGSFALIDAMGGLPGASDADEWAFDWLLYDRVGSTAMFARAPAEIDKEVFVLGHTDLKYDPSTQVAKFAPGTVYFKQDLYDSGANLVLFFDGGASSALAIRRTPASDPEYLVLGPRHWKYLPSWKFMQKPRINNYLMFNVTSSIEGW